MSNEFWAEFEQLLDQRCHEAIEYRVHYNDGGEIYLCTMQNHPVETQYLIVTKDEYDNYFNYRIVNGMLKRVVHDGGYHVQLQKSSSGYMTVKGHAGLLLENEEYPEIEHYEYRNN
jgi:hypothetical protein